METQPLFKMKAGQPKVLFARRFHLAVSLLVVLFMIVAALFPGLMVKYFYSGIESSPDVLKIASYMWKINASAMMFYSAMMFALSRSNDLVLLRRSCIANGIVWCCCQENVLFLTNSDFAGIGVKFAVIFHIFCVCGFAVAYWGLASITASEPPQYNAIEDTEQPTLAKRVHAVFFVWVLLMMSSWVFGVSDEKKLDEMFQNIELTVPVSQMLGLLEWYYVPIVAGYAACIFLLALSDHSSTLKLSCLVNSAVWTMYLAVPIAFLVSGAGGDVWTEDLFCTPFIVGVFLCSFFRTRNNVSSSSTNAREVETIIAQV